EHLFDYDDYHKFLQDYFDEQKNLSTAFSHRFFAAKAGFKTSSYCLNVIRGRFKLTQKSAEKIAAAMGMGVLQQAFFLSLVEFNQSEKIEKRDAAWEQICQVKRQAEFTHLTNREQTYFSRWYHPIIRELVVTSKWNDDYKALAKMVVPAITAAEAKDGVKNLLELGLIRKSEGRYEQTSLMIDASDVSPIALKGIRRDYIQHALRAVECIPRDEQYAAFTTLAMSEKSFHYVVQVMKEARKKIMAKISNDMDVERVYEMMFMTFPMSTRIQKDEK
ncbi:MAG: TIGR02147 family protein, partial [Fibrobacter sp.]|nr:TIGR02147 family protein [Fibrobacter sp.]